MANDYLNFSRAFGHKVRYLIELFKKPARFLKAMGRVWVHDTKRFQFGPGGSPPFAPLDPRYRRRKIQVWGHRPILTASGAMRRALRFFVRSPLVFLGSPVTAGRHNRLDLHRFGRGRLPVRDPFQRVIPRTEKTTIKQMENELYRRLRKG